MINTLSTKNPNICIKIVFENQGNIYKRREIHETIFILCEIKIIVCPHTTYILI